jgi:hypothetical protein
MGSAHMGSPIGARRFVAQRGDFFFRGRDSFFCGRDSFFRWRDSFFRGRERREGEFGPWAGFWGDYYPYDYPGEYPASYDQPSYPYSYPDVPPLERYGARPPLRCDTNSQKVPSEKGGETTINVTRCY